MDVTFLGTGAAGGWPQAFCGCASCESAYTEGEIRAHTSVLVDRTLLLDCGQDVPRSAARLGVRLDGVRHVVVTHDHFDHANGALLLARRWSRATEALDVVGPPAALAALAMWLPPDDPGVRFVPVAAGDELTLGDVRARAIAADHDSDGALLYDLTTADGTRLLYATDTGPGFAVPAGARYDLLLLDESWGDRRPGGASGHHDLTAFAATLARLRRAGSIDDRTRICAIHVGHGNPAPSALRARLRAFDAELPRDGDTVSVGRTTSAPRAPRPRRVLVLGGARSGKSAVAEGLLAAHPRVVYLATSTPTAGDAEWNERVRAHRQRRPASWETLETADVSTVLRQRDAGDAPVLVDCLTVWLDRAMDAAGVWTARDDVTAKAADVALAAAVDDLVAAWHSTRGHVVAVSNEVGSGIVPDTASGRRFRDELGTLNARMAAVSDDVVLVTAGIARSLIAAADTLRDMATFDRATFDRATFDEAQVSDRAPDA